MPSKSRDSNGPVNGGVMVKSKDSGLDTSDQWKAIEKSLVIGGENIASTDHKADFVEKVPLTVETNRSKKIKKGKPDASLDRWVSQKSERSHV